MLGIGRFRYLEALPPQGVRPRGTLLLLHAFPLTARMWEPQLSLAGQGWRVVAPQLRGFDGSPAEPPARTVDDYAGDLVDVLDGLHIETAVVAGLSMGGYVAFALLRLAPRYVRGLVLADTRPQADPPEAVAGREDMMRLVRASGPSAVADRMVPRLLGASTIASQPAIADHVRSLILSNSAESIASALMAMRDRPDATPLLATIRCPTLVVVGEEDVLTPRPLSEAMHAMIGGSEFAAIAGAGHLANLEQPAAFNHVLATFLERRV